MSADRAACQARPTRTWLALPCHVVGVPTLHRLSRSFEREATKDDRSAADNSAIGQSVRRAETVLRLIKAAGLAVVAKDLNSGQFVNLSRLTAWPYSAYSANGKGTIHDASQRPQMWPHGQEVQQSCYDTCVDDVPAGFVIVGKAGVNCKECGLPAKG